MTEQKFDPDDRKNQLSPQLKLSFWRVPSFITFGLLLIALLFFGFNRNQQVPSKDITFVEGNTKFALNLYSQLRTQPGNLFLSPYSISTAIAMTAAGAKGKTATQIDRVFSFNLPPASRSPAFAQLTYQLTDARGYQLSIANRLWAQKDFPLLPPFVKTTQDFYGAPIESLNFANADEASGKINAWVAKQTQNQIKDLLSPDDLDSCTRLVLTNAIYFKGNWVTQFDSAETTNQPFTLASGEKQQVAMMVQSNNFGYAEFENLQVLEMPYQGNKLSLVILLPANPDGLPKLEGALTADNLQKWLSFSQRKVQVFLPKFTFQQSFNLKDVLSKMGMADAFSYQPGVADFSGLSNKENLFVSDVIHKAFVEVDEKGSKAAAATAVIECTGEMGCPSPLPRQIEFRADRPFLFLIRERQSGTILFMGRFANPALKNSHPVKTIPKPQSSSCQ
jgi:Serine protease inhibitor